MEQSDIGRARRWPRWVRRNDSLRRAVAPALNDALPLPADAAREALARLERPGWLRWQAVALSALVLGNSRLEGEERERALALLRRLAERGQRRETWPRVALGLTWGFVAAIPWQYLGVVAWQWSRLLGSVIIMSGWVPLAVGGLLGEWCGRRAGAHLRAEAIGALSRLGDRESIELVAAAALDALDPPAGMANRALAQLACQLTTEDYAATGPRAVPLLCRVLSRNAFDLTRSPSPELAVALLEALARMGDGRAVITVKAIAERCPAAALKARAAEVLPVLLARQAQERDTGRLLRPADTAESSALLRPAQGAPDAQTAALLRPAGSGGGPPSG